MLPRILIVGLLALILGVPFLMRPEEPKVEDVGPEGTLVVVTPHVPQIQHEFGLAFDRWHRRVHGTPVRIDWRQPGGTSEIIKQLAAQYSSRCAEVVKAWGAASPERLASPTLDLAAEFPPGSVAFDVMFGGGSFDHGRLKDVNTASYWFRPFPGEAAAEALVRTKGPVDPATVVNERQLIATVTRDGGPAMVLRIPLAAMVDQAAALAAIAQASSQSPPGDARVRLDISQLERQAGVSISVPAGFEQARLDEWYGPNVLGAGTLYDPQQHWLGTAISGFGIVYNTDVLAKLAVDAPSSFEDLTDPRLVGWLVFADPRQSGSVATAIDSVLSYHGWEKGWKVLREMCANTRYYTNTAPRPPIDVTEGEAAAGLCIDFYGRNQSQAVLSPGETDVSKSRVGYVDPQGATYMDADPVSILRGGPNAALAKRFVEFTLTEEAQALWQFPSKRDPASATNPVGESKVAMGPDHHELRRMPVRRVMYERHLDHMIDRVDPFQIATTTKPAGWRSTIGVMMGGFGIETADLQVRPWKALNAARANPAFDKATLAAV